MRKGAEGSYTGNDVLRLFEEQQGCCAYCGESLIDYHIDHVIPLSRGGSNWPENLCLACSECNLQKGALTPDEFWILRA